MTQQRDAMLVVENFFQLWWTVWTGSHSVEIEDGHIVIAGLAKRLKKRLPLFSRMDRIGQADKQKSERKQYQACGGMQFYPVTTMRMRGGHLLPVFLFQTVSVPNKQGGELASNFTAPPLWLLSQQNTPTYKNKLRLGRVQAI